jgi:hypothetical protein
VEWRLLERRQPIHLYRRRLSVLLEMVPILGLALSLLVLQLLSFVLVRLRQLLRIKTAILLTLDPSWFPGPASPGKLCQRNPSG